MNLKKSLFIILFLFIITLTLNEVNAICFDLKITGESSVDTNKSINLTALLEVYNDLYVPDLPDGGMGKVKTDNVTNEVLWSSSNPSVATVNSNGKVTGVSSGVVTVTATYDNNWTATHEIRVFASNYIEPSEPEEPTVNPTPDITPIPTPDIPVVEPSPGAEEEIYEEIFSPVFTPEFDEPENGEIIYEEDKIYIDGGYEEDYVRDENGNIIYWGPQGDSQKNYGQEIYSDPVYSYDYTTPLSDDLVLVNDSEETDLYFDEAELNNYDLHFVIIYIVIAVIIIIVIVITIILSKKNK